MFTTPDNMDLVLSPLPPNTCSAQCYTENTLVKLTLRCFTRVNNTKAKYCQVALRPLFEQRETLKALLRLTCAHDVQVTV